ncbi:MAG: cellulose binding domain-containing protein [Actinomycetota bacterium]
MRESWSGTVVVTGRLVNVVSPSWGGTIAAGGSVRHFGFCLEGVGTPTGVLAQ